MKNTQVHVVVISLFIHLAASRMEDVVVDAPAYRASRVESIFGEGRTVKITNKLGGGLKLTLHCKSKDDDLGVQTLAPDSSWSFKFKPAFFGTTLFFCNFDWGGESHWFDIYDDDRDRVSDNQCYLCSWNINRSYPCRFDESTNRFDLCYDWNK
ncbi:hypothetical protein YC2023_026780 [Brassica napus]